MLFLMSLPAFIFKRISDFKRAALRSGPDKYRQVLIKSLATVLDFVIFLLRLMMAPPCLQQYLVGCPDKRLVGYAFFSTAGNQKNNYFLLICIPLLYILLELPFYFYRNMIRSSLEHY